MFRWFGPAGFYSSGTQGWLPWIAHETIIKLYLFPIATFDSWKEIICQCWGFGMFWWPLLFSSARLESPATVNTKHETCVTKGGLWQTWLANLFTNNYGGFLKWWYPQSSSKSWTSILVLKPIYIYNIWYMIYGGVWGFVDPPVTF